MTADLALLANDPTALELVDDPAQQIELACQRANAWLKNALDHDVRIETIVETKAQAAALAAFAVQKQLGKDAELAALEVQRRAERGTGLAIRRGQERGEINRRGDNRHTLSRTTDAEVLGGASPYDFATHGELYGDGRAGGNGAYAMADGVTDEQFDAAIEGAKAEGNLSRANVVRKVKGDKSEGLTKAQRIDRIRTMGAAGHTSHHIGRDIGITAEHVRELARQNDIDLPADKAVGRTRHIDSNKVVAEIVASVAELALPMRLVNFEDLDAAEATEWANSLTDSIRALNRFTKQIKELAL